MFVEYNRMHLGFAHFICKPFSARRRPFLALSAAGQARGPPAGHGARLNPSRPPVFSREYVPPRRAKQSHGNPHVQLLFCSLCCCYLLQHTAVKLFDTSRQPRYNSSRAPSFLWLSRAATAATAAPITATFSRPKPKSTALHRAPSYPTGWR